MAAPFKTIPTNIKLQIAELADQGGQPSYEAIAKSHEVTYQEVKKWHELYCAGALQRQIQVEEFCNATMSKRLIKKVINLRPDLFNSPNFKSESSTDKPH